MNKPSGLVLALCVALGLTAACSRPPNGTTEQLMPDARKSWMAAGLANQDLLYVSNGNAEVTVYRYWKHTLVGVLTNFTTPMGECVDSAGDVYITDASTKEILEYAHGGTKPIKTFDDSPDAPYACSVNQATGDLAVANDNGASQTGDLAIWAAATGTRVTYTDSSIDRFRGCAYDNRGNLLVTNGAAFAWLPKAGAKLVDVRVPGPDPSWKWGGVQGIQWDGKFFAVDDYDGVIRISLMHGQAYYVGDTSLYFGGAGSSGPYWIYNNHPSGQGTQIVGGAREDSRSWVMFWHYPQGGTTLYQLTHGVDQPFAVAVSLKR